MEPHQTEQFAALWTASQSTILAFVRSLIPDLYQSDEVLQRVAVALVRNFDRYDTSRPFGPWAIGVAKYEVLYFRRERATDRHLFSEALIDQIASRYEQLTTEVDPIRKALEHCVDELQGRSKQVIELRYRDGMKSNAIAKKIKSTSGAVRMLLSRVRAILQRCIEEQVAGLDLS